MIYLSRGLFMLVDKIDYEYMNQWLWSASINWSDRETSEIRTVYAVHTVEGTSKQAHIAIAKRSDIYVSGLVVDHIDGCGLNNQRSNLQMLSHQENIRKARLPRNNKSGHKGICFDNIRGKWKAYIKRDGRIIWQKRFDDIDEAVKARQLRYAKEVWTT